MIIVNRFFDIAEQETLSAEFINRYRADDGRQYIWLNSGLGNILLPKGEQCFAIQVRESGNACYRVESCCRLLEAVDLSKCRLESGTEEPRYGGCALSEILHLNEDSGRRKSLAIFHVADFRRAVDDFFIASDMDSVPVCFDDVAGVYELEQFISGSDIFRRRVKSGSRVHDLLSAIMDARENWTGENPRFELKNETGSPDAKIAATGCGKSRVNCVEKSMEKNAEDAESQVAEKNIAGGILELLGADRRENNLVSWLACYLRDPDFCAGFVARCLLPDLKESEIGRLMADLRPAVVTRGGGMIYLESSRLAIAIRVKTDTRTERISQLLRSRKKDQNFEQAFIFPGGSEKKNCRSILLLPEWACDRSLPGYASWTPLGFRRVYDFFKSISDDARQAGRHPYLGEFVEALESLSLSRRSDFWESADRSLSGRIREIRNGRHES